MFIVKHNIQHFNPPCGRHPGHDHKITLSICNCNCSFSCILPKPQISQALTHQNGFQHHQAGGWRLLGTVFGGIGFLGLQDLACAAAGRGPGCDQAAWLEKGLRSVHRRGLGLLAWPTVPLPLHHCTACPLHSLSQCRAFTATQPVHCMRADAASSGQTAQEMLAGHKGASAWVLITNGPEHPVRWISVQAVGEESCR